MGYTTTFEGNVSIEPPLNHDELTYLRDFSDSRRMHRRKGPFFVGGSGFKGQDRDDDVINSNSPDPTQPGLWCQWVPTGSGKALHWDGGEKFYHAAEWMRYLIDYLLTDRKNNPRTTQNTLIVQDARLAHFTFNHTLNGVIWATGEDGDTWTLLVENNEVSTEAGHTLSIVT